MSIIPPTSQEANDDAYDAAYQALIINIPETTVEEAITFHDVYNELFVREDNKDE